MSIEIDGYLKKYIFSEERFTELLNEFFSSNASKEIADNGTVAYWNFYENNELIAYLFDYTDDMLCHKSRLLNCAFSSLQGISFWIDKFSDLEKNYKTIFEFLIFLEKKYPFEMLLIDFTDEEICYIDEHLNFKWGKDTGYIVPDLLKEFGLL